jgi:hypothetical protein
MIEHKKSMPPIKSDPKKTNAISSKIPKKLSSTHANNLGKNSPDLFGLIMFCGKKFFFKKSEKRKQKTFFFHWQPKENPIDYILACFDPSRFEC